MYSSTLIKRNLFLRINCQGVSQPAAVVAHVEPVLSMGNGGGGYSWAVVVLTKNKCLQVNLWWYEPNRGTTITASNYANSIQVQDLLYVQHGHNVQKNKEIISVIHGNPDKLMFSWLYAFITSWRPIAWWGILTQSSFELDVFKHFKFWSWGWREILLDVCLKVLSSTIGNTAKNLTWQNVLLALSSKRMVQPNLNKTYLLTYFLTQQSCHHANSPGTISNRWRPGSSWLADSSLTWLPWRGIQPCRTKERKRREMDRLKNSLTDR